METEAPVGGNAVEAGTSTSEFKVLIAGFVTPILLPLVNGLLAKIGAAPFTSDQIQMDCLALIALAGAWIGARTVRKAVADRSAAK